MTAGRLWHALFLASVCCGLLVSGLAAAPLLAEPAGRSDFAGTSASGSAAAAGIAG
jgi:hypothetical protein